MTGVEGADHVIGVGVVPPTLDKVALDPFNSDLMCGVVRAGCGLLPRHQSHLVSCIQF